MERFTRRVAKVAQRAANNLLLCESNLNRLTSNFTASQSKFLANQAWDIAQEVKLKSDELR
jgi:transcriptional regulator of met regulon